MRHAALEPTPRPGRPAKVSAPPATHPDEPLGAALRGVWTQFREVVREHAVLAVLEAQRAGMHLVYLVAAVLVVSVLVVSTWLCGVTALVIWLAGNNIPWPGLLLLAALLNLLAGAAVVFWAKGRVTEVPFSATLRQLSAERQEISARSGHAQVTRP